MHLFLKHPRHQGMPAGRRKVLIGQSQQFLHRITEHIPEHLIAFDELSLQIHLRVGVHQAFMELPVFGLAALQLLLVVLEGRDVVEHVDAADD